MQDTLTNQIPIYSLIIAVTNFQPLIRIESQNSAVREYSQDIKQYVKEWCKEWNFKTGKLKLTINTANNIPSLSIEDVLDEVSNP